MVHLFEEGNAEGEYAEGGGAEVRWVQSRSEVKQESLKGCPPPLPMSLPRNQLKRLGMSSSLAVAEACERFLSDQVDDIPLQAVRFSSCHSSVFMSTTYCVRLLWQILSHA